MGQVDIAINGKTYRIACEDGEEQRLSNLAAMVDAHVHDLIEQVGQIGGKPAVGDGEFTDRR